MPASDRVFTFLFPTAEDKARWKKLAEPLTLNRWIFLQVERAIEDAPVTTRTTTDDINALRKENLELRKENEAMAAKLDQSRAREVEDILERSKGPMPMDKHVVDLLRSGGYWTSTKLIKKLAQEAAPEAMQAFRMDDDDASNSVVAADFFSNFNENLTLEVDVKAVERTLDALEQIGLVKKSWQGWKWNKT
ncbi:MAG: hypothetical protein ABR985_02260 [Methanotrichaceae archaeon]|jgi:hypothetical protein